MGKKILSLLLSLSMVMAIIANCTIVSAIGSEPKIYVEYYSDESLEEQYKITSSTVDVGATFYAVVGLNDLEACTTANIVVGFDPSKVDLVNFDGDNVVTLPAGGVQGKSTLGNDQNNIKIYGVKILTPTGFTLTFNDANPKVVEKADRFVSNTEVANGEKSVLVDFTMYSTTGINVAQPTPVLVYKFKAIDEGSTKLTFPKKVSGATGDYYSGQYGVFLGSNEGNALLGVTPDPQEGIYCITETNPTITFVRNIPKLSKPANVQLNGREITWTAVTTTATGDPVASNKISDYEVTVTSTGGIGAGTYVIKGNDTTNSSAQLPAEIVCGDLTITVKAVSTDPATLASSEPSDVLIPERVKVNLTAPGNVQWNQANSTEVIWDEVPYATAYKVELTENGNPVAISPETVTVNAFDFANYLNDPAAGEKNEYIVKVTALGDGEYVISDTTGATAPVKKKVGRVRNATNVTWEQDSLKAIWNDSNDAAIVGGYSVRLYKDDDLVAEQTTNAKNFNFATYMQEPGIYTYDVKVLGKTTADGTYDDAENYVASGVKVVSKELDKVTNIQWNGKVATWEADGVHSYTIQVFKGGSQIGNDIIATDKTYDFSSLMSTKGTYTVKIKVNGQLPVYLDSDWEESDVTITKNTHTAATGLTWNGTVAEWTADPNATSGYTVQLYYEGIKVEGVTDDTDANSYDFAGKFDWPGKYTFSVVKEETDDLLASEEVISTQFYEMTTISRVGDIIVKAYEDEACTSEITAGTTLPVGSVFYLTIGMSGTRDFDTFAFPLEFDPSKVKIVGSDNIPVADGPLTAAEVATGEKGIVSGAVLDRMALLEGEGFTTIDNTNGTLYVMAMGECSIANTEENVITVKMIVNSYSSDPIEFAFGKEYDGIITGGFLCAKAGEPLFANEIYPAPITIVVGQLPKMAAPVWDGTNITWVKSGSPNITSYSIELYKNGVCIETITDISKNADSYALASKVGSVGTYTVRIKAVGDANATDSDWSDMSAGYVRRGGGGGSAGQATKPTEPVEPDKPVEPEEPTIEFTDIDGHWAEEKIIELSAYGILAGYGDGTFRPNFGITRAEFTKLMVSALGYDDYEVAKPVVYEDTTSHWAKDYISIGTELGFVSGIGDNLFAPDVIITREQVAAIIYRIAGEVENVPVSGYADRDAVSKYAKPAVDYVSEQNIMIGFEDNTFRGKEQTTRAQMVIVLLKLLNNGFFDNYKMTK